MAQLTGEEREIVKAFEAGTLQSPPDRSAILKAHREYAAATFRKDRRVNVRISSRDLDALRKELCRRASPTRL